MQIIEFPIYQLIFSFFVTYTSIPSIIRISKKNGLLDFPNSRKLHKSPTVRLGGLSIFIGLYSSLLVSFIFGVFSEYKVLDINGFLVLISGGFMFFCLGFIEDLITLSPFLRLSFQFIFAFILWMQGLRIEGLNLSLINIRFFDFAISSNLSILITCLFIVTIINAFNWMDGLDGLASGIAIILFIFLSFLENNNIFLISSLIGASFAFFIFNIRGSTIMMGDGGSYLLGVFMSIMTIFGSYSFDSESTSKSLNLAVPFFLLLVPLFDMGRVIFLRIINGKSIFYPDKKHIHHLFLKNGFNQKEALIYILIFSIIFSILGLAFAF